jgi:CheY-like chemotaxis protein
VARVLICEPHPEVRELLRRIVMRLGHEPVLDDAALGEVEAIVVEPAHTPSVERAQAFRAFAGEVPLICASIDLPNGGTRRLRPVAYLVKPFALPEIEAALTSALAGQPVPA